MTVVRHELLSEDLILNVKEHCWLLSALSLKLESNYVGVIRYMMDTKIQFVIKRGLSKKKRKRQKRDRSDESSEQQIYRAVIKTSHSLIMETAACLSSGSQY